MSLHDVLPEFAYVRVRLLPDLNAQALKTLNAHPSIGRRPVSVVLLQLEALSITEQLREIVKTDVLVGMHGAGECLQSI